MDDLEQMRLRARARPARLRREERLRRRRHRRLRRDRLGAHGGARASRRSARTACTACRCRRATRRRRRDGDARRLAESARDRTSARSPIEPIVEAFTTRRSQSRSPGRRADLDRGEPAGTDPRHAADGALEQVRLARDRDRATSRSCRSATRRSTATSPAGSRCSRTCTRPTSSGSRKPPERARGPRADPAVDHRARAERRAARRPARRGLAAAVRRSSTGCSRRTSSSTARARSCRSDGFDPRRGRARARADRPGRVQAPSGTARRQAAAEGVRPRPAHADHQPLAELANNRCQAPWWEPQESATFLPQPLPRGAFGCRLSSFDAPGVVGRTPRAGSAGFAHRVRVARPAGGMRAGSAAACPRSGRLADERESDIDHRHRVPAA